MDEKPKSKLLNWLSWIFSIVLALAGIGGFANGDVPSATFALLAAALLFPPLNALYRRVAMPGWVRVTLILACVVMVGVFAPATKEAPPPPDSTPAPERATKPEPPVAKPHLTHEQAIKAFNQCLLSNARQHDEYTSSDGGHSAMLVLGACQPQFDAYWTDCMGGRTDHEADSSCTVNAGILAQAALKLLNK